MKKEVNLVKYYCDLCKKEVSDEKKLIMDCTVLGTRKEKVDANTIKSTIVRVKHQDICAECAAKLASLVVVDSKNRISFAPVVKETPKPKEKTVAKTSTVTKAAPVTKTAPATKTVPVNKTVPANKATTATKAATTTKSTPTTKQVQTTKTSNTTARSNDGFRTIELPNPKDMVVKQNLKITRPK